MNLIDNADNFEVVRDQIAAILVIERDDQKAQAAAAGKDPALWDFKVFEERSNPWGDYLDEGADLTPIVNVWFDSDSFVEAATTRSQTQKCNAFYNIDITAAARRTAGLNGDEAAAKTAQRIARIARKILMASEYTYLALPRGTCWDRQIESRETFQPGIGADSSTRVIGLRLRMRVSFNETAPQFEGVPLNGIDLEIKRKETGEIYTDLSFEYGPGWYSSKGVIRVDKDIQNCDAEIPCA